MKRYLLTIVATLLCIVLKAQSVSYSCRYWFDRNYAQVVTTSFSESSWQTELDVGSLSEGLHTLVLQICDTSLVWNMPKSYLFYKTLSDQTDITYHCWFDDDIEHHQTDSLGNGHLLLDVASLSEGIHTLNIMLEGNTPKCYMFMKVAVQDPTAEVQYRCWFDNDYNMIQTGSVGAGVFELEVGGLSDGMHTVHVQLDNGTPSLPQCYVFYKRPVGGNIAKWEYWLNGEYSSKHTTNLSSFVDTLDIISLLPVETWPIRSTCFHFHPNGEEPYINAKNKISFRFWDTEDYYIEQSMFYVDENVVESIVAEDIERNTTKTIVAPRNNQIHWLKLNVGRGDYLSFQADKACTMQLFAPSGEEIYAVSGPESIVLEGFNVWEDGTYYLAVHDVTGIGETVSVTYNWVYRYVIDSYDVHLVGNGGCSTITYQGNGFNSLLDAYFVNYQNDTIRYLDIGHESNTRTTISFNFYGENLGAYDAVFEFFEETIRINGALEVQEPVDIVLTSSVSYPSTFLRNTTCTYTYTITNNGNMSAYAVPIFVYIDSPTIDGISHIEFDGLNLPSIVDNLNLNFLSPSQIEELKQLEDELGDEPFFGLLKMLDDEKGDTIITRCNYFFINLAPLETKTLKLKIIANEQIHVWITIPNEIIQPITTIDNRGLNQYCCVHEKLECYATIVASSLNWSSLIADAAGIASLLFGPEAIPVSAVLLTIGNSLTIASCFASYIQDKQTTTRKIVCAEEQDIYYYLRLALTASCPFYADISWGTIFSCIPMYNVIKDGVKVTKDAVKCLRLALLKQTAVGLGTDSPTPWLSDFHCLREFHKKWPNCPPGDHKGGKSTAVRPLDPNDIYGYLSESGSHYMRQEIQNVQYEIEFENDTTLATAAAHTIIVRDTLDATKFDLNSLAARSVTIGDKRLDLNGEQTFARTLDLRPDIYVIAQINQDYDPTTGIIQWTIQSLDPMTMEPTDDPNQGVLPVNYYGDGVGFIDYSVNLREAFADGTEISNRAGIIFDQNDVIMTPTWTNIVDAVKPTSHIEEVTLMGDSLSFSFISSDNRSGVWYHSLYYRNASTEQEWQVRKAQIFEDSFMLQFDSLQTTEYFVIAVDSAGNVEAMKTEAEVVVESSVSGYPLFVAGYGESTNAGWKFIASPVAGSIAATMVDSIFSATQYDLYYFDQGKESEWRNYKSNSFNLTNGQGYLYASKEDKTLVFKGAYNEAETQEVSLNYAETNPHTDMRGWNLIGNPFTVPAYVNRSYYTMNEDGTAIEPVAVSGVTSIPACHGVMVKAETSGETVTFSRTVQQNAANWGGIQIAVTQATTRGYTVHDKAIVSFNPNDQLGKFNFNESNAKVYIPQDGKDYAIAYADKTGEVPVNFKAVKSGTYTITVNADGMEFNFFHLIDNLTGTDVDLLVEPSCTFHAKTTDYASRFHLVFSVGGDEEDDNAPFAFINNGNIVIIGADAGSTLQIVDVTGRILVSRGGDEMNRISTNGMASGMYVLRLINGEDVKTQKIVIE